MVDTVAYEAPAMRAGLAQLIEGHDIDRDLVAQVFREVMAGACDPAQVGALLLGLAQKGESLGEIAGAVTAMREAVIPIRSERRPLLDTCGTGGSGVPRRNVSTAVAIVLAACGVPVAKHGNRGASSPCGSADVLAELGVNIEAEPDVVGRCIDVVGVGFLFAPRLHPAMKHAMGPRRALGVRTIFNLLGPLTNPAGASRQLLGIYDPARCETLASVLGSLGSERVLVVHGFRNGVQAAVDASPGIDDLSPEGETLVAEYYGGRVRKMIFRPDLARLDPVPIAALAGEDPKGNAAALRRLLEGEQGPYRTAVQYSGAAAFLAGTEGRAKDLGKYSRRIADVLDDGSALRVLERLIACSHGRELPDP
jgi:anthranilate phosphoribosyltransferase